MYMYMYTSIKIRKKNILPNNLMKGFFIGLKCFSRDSNKNYRYIIPNLISCLSSSSIESSSSVGSR